MIPNLNSSNNKYNEILSIISPPIYMENIHNHPLLFCLPLERNKFGSSWICNKCNSNYDYTNPSFYCTFCDFDLCPNCLGENQLDKIVFYNPNSNVSNNIKNIPQGSNIFQWQKKFPKHIHLLTLIEKVNKNASWTCDNCSKKYENKETSYYCSLCDYDACKKCFEVEVEKSKPIMPINPFIQIEPRVAPQKIEKISDFQIKSFQILNEKYNNKNLIYSPLSIQILLGLFLNALSGKALNELKDVFLFQDIQSQNNIYMKILQSLSNISSINMANVVFCPFETLSNFKTHINNYKTIFSKNKDEINQYIKNITNNKVNNFFDSSILFGMFLANILCFKEGWKNKFQENAFQKTFYASNNIQKKVKTMYLTEDFKYYKDKSLEIVEIPYKNENLSAIILLPDKEISLDNLIKQLSQEKMDLLLNKLSLHKIDLTIPKFNIYENNKIYLEDMLKKIGINSIFDSANYSQLFGNSQNTIINEIMQTNIIEVDENGNDNNIFSFMGKPLNYAKNMVVNRPFLFIVRNNQFEKGKDILLIVKVEDI